MPTREKFGRLVLIEPEASGPLGNEYRAARLGPTGLERIVTLLRFGSAVSSSAEATKRLVDEARLAARIHSPGLVRVLGIGRVEHSFYVSTELVEGKSLAAILERCRREAFPFAAEHALMVASRSAAALEPLHARKDDAGQALVHGLLAPSRLVVAYDGEVKVKGMGLWRGLQGTGLLPPEEGRYLAPEQARGGAGDPRSDVYALGLLLLEALAGHAPDGTDPASHLAGAEVTSTTGERTALPGPIADLVRRALEPDPDRRYGDAAALRKAIDALLFSGDFAPTTFDLAFFMHTLFRQEMEGEARALEEARRADYREFLADDKAGAASLPTEPAPASGRAPAAPVPPTSRSTEIPAPTLVEAAPRNDSDRSSPGPGADASGSRGSSRAAREAAARMTFGSTTSAPAGRRSPWLLMGLLLAVVASSGGAGWWYFAKRRSPAVSAPTTLSAAAAAAQQRIRQLEERISELEREKAEAENRAAEEARQTLEARARAGGKTVDPAAVQVAQAEARRRARVEQETRQQEERRRLADEKDAETVRAAAASPTPTPVPASEPTATPTPETTPAPEPEPAPTLTPPTLRPGTLVDANDPGLTPPVAIDSTPPPYPPLALARRLDGKVELRALVDENGRVIEASVVKVTPRGFGFDEAALQSVRGRRYQPGTKEGVAVRVWMTITVNFRAPRR